MRQEEKDYLYKEHKSNGDNAYEQINFLMKELKGYKQLKTKLRNLQKENEKLKDKLSQIQKKLIIKDISKPEKKSKEPKDLNLNTLKRMYRYMDKSKFYGIKELELEMCSSGLKINQCLEVLKALDLVEVKFDGRYNQYKLK
jgi:response regulator of citrate/malate metabolism